MKTQLLCEECNVNYIQIFCGQRGQRYVPSSYVECIMSDSLHSAKDTIIPL